MRTKKVAFIMIDGLADRSLPQLQNKTPLEYATIPNIDNLAKYGVSGLMDPVEPGLACGSDTAHMSIFGYDPRLFYKGRGSYETMGAGLHMEKGDIAFKSNFATWDPETNVVVQRRADRNFEHLGPELCEYLTQHVKLPSFPEYEVAFKYATEHRCGVRVRGPGLSGDITGTDPLRDGRPLVKCEAVDPQDSAAVKTSLIVNELSMAIHNCLKQHPINEQRKKEGKAEANIVLLRGCGIRIDVPTFEQKHNFKAFMIAPTAIIAGLGMSLDIDVKKAPGATGDYHTNLDSKHKVFVENITTPQYNFGFFHVKAVDDAGHDGNVEMKLKFIHKIDEVIGNLVRDLKADKASDYAIVLTGDHSTPLLYGDHSDEPVPFVICKVDNIGAEKSNAYVDSVQQFSEVDAAAGILGRFCGGEVLDIIRKYHFEN